MKIPFIASAIFTSLLCLSLRAADNTLWTKGIFAQSASAPQPFILNIFTQEGLHLTGNCAYKRADEQPPRLIEGTKTYNDEFWPDVTGQVKNEKTGAWETVSLPLDYGRRATIEVKAGELKQDLLVSLDVFLPLVGKYKVGRVVLKTGEAAEFDLFELLSVEECRRRNIGK
jgi:hypothetical protein